MDEGHLLHGDLGDSLWRNTPVLQEIIDRLSITPELGLLSLFIAVPVAIYSAGR